jgi:hypothetical protein
MTTPSMPDGIHYNEETGCFELWVEGMIIDWSEDRADMEVIEETGRLMMQDNERRQKAWSDALRTLPADLQTQFVH